MTWKKLIGSGVAALALLAFASTFEPVQARHGGGGGGHFHMGGAAHHFAPRFHHFRHHHAFRHHHFRHHRFHRHRLVVVSAYPYYYADGCYWLKRRALYTGSPYWWNRYYACRSGYYGY
jgi:hypothetical protein